MGKREFPLSPFPTFPLAPFPLVTNRDHEINDLRRELRELRGELARETSRKYVRLGQAQTSPATIGFNRCKCQAKGAFSTTTTTITVDNVVAEHGDSPLVDPSSTTETLQVRNRFAWDGVDNADLVIEYDKSIGQWYISQKGC